MHFCFNKTHRLVLNSQTHDHSPSPPSPGIFLFKSMQSALIHAKTDEFVVQKYIAKPLLMDGFKFDFRVYVLVTSCDPLRVFIHREGLARFSTCQYESPTDENIVRLLHTQACCIDDLLNQLNSFMHLTNYAINKQNRHFKHDGDGSAGGKSKRLVGGGCKFHFFSTRSLTSVFKELEDKGYDVDFIWTQMTESIVKTLLVVQPTLNRFYTAASSLSKLKNAMVRENLLEMDEKTGGGGVRDGGWLKMEDLLPRHSQCFEILGFDVILDQKLKPWVLEVNHSPSLTCDSNLDLRVKGKVLEDTMKLLGMAGASSDFKKRIQLEEKKWCAKRLLPSKSGTARKQRSHAPSLSDAPVEPQSDSQPTTESPRQASFLQQLDAWESENSGGFECIYPHANAIKQAHYEKILQKTTALSSLDQRDTNATKCRREYFREKREREHHNRQRFDSLKQKSSPPTSPVTSFCRCPSPRPSSALDKSGQGHIAEMIHRSSVGDSVAPEMTNFEVGRNSADFENLSFPITSFPRLLQDFDESGRWSHQSSSSATSNPSLTTKQNLVAMLQVEKSDKWRKTLQRVKSALPLTKSISQMADKSLMHRSPSEKIQDLKLLTIQSLSFPCSSLSNSMTLPRVASDKGHGNMETTTAPHPRSILLSTSKRKQQRQESSSALSDTIRAKSFDFAAFLEVSTKMNALTVTKPTLQTTWPNVASTSTVVKLAFRVNEHSYGAVRVSESRLPSI